MNDHDRNANLPIDVQEDKLYDLEALAELLGVSSRTLQKMGDDKLPMSIKPAGKKLYPRLSINVWITNNNPQLWDLVNPASPAMAAIQKAS